MELLILWLGTVLVSFGLDLSAASKMFRDVADQGYKIDVKRLGEVSKQLTPEMQKMNTVALFIPVFNIMFQVVKMAKYNAARPFIADQLRVMDCLTLFTKEEEEKYKLNPTGLNALIVTMKSEIDKEEEDMSIVFDDGDGKNEMWFKSENEKLTITKSNGPVSKLSAIEQQAKIEEKFVMLGSEILMSGMSIEEFQKQLTSGKIIDLNKLPKKEINDYIMEAGNKDAALQELYRKRKEFEELKNILMGSSAQISTQDEESKNISDSQLIKTKKPTKK